LFKQEKQEDLMSKFKVFVIEDNRTEGLLLQLALSEIPNLEVKTYANAGLMLEEISEQPEIAVIDLNLPDMSGLELIREIKESSPKTRMVVVSAQRDMDVLAEVQAEGVYNYLVKSEACLTYLGTVVEELLIVIKHKK
jgi:DNA-binding NtrC family response regulator